MRILTYIFVIRDTVLTNCACTSVYVLVRTCLCVFLCLVSNSRAYTLDILMRARFSIATEKGTYNSMSGFLNFTEKKSKTQGRHFESYDHVITLVFILIRKETYHSNFKLKLWFEVNWYLCFSQNLTTWMIVAMNSN